MHRKAARFVLYSQLTFVVMVAVCLLLNPSVLLSNTALSVYGSYSPTFVPFVIGMVTMAVLLCLAARCLPAAPKANRTLAKFLYTIALFTISLAVTPLSYNKLAYTVHITIALVLALINVLTAAWILTKVHRDSINFGLFTLMNIGALIGVLSMTEVGVLHLLAVGQLLAVLSFAILLARSVFQMEHVEF